MKIRRYETGDREQLIDLWKQVFPDDPPHNAPDKAIPAKLAVDNLIFVVELDEKIIGACMAGYDGHRGWLYMVGVDQAYRKKGIGEALVRFVMDHLKGLGCVKVNLQIRAGNDQVEGFYRALGFAVEERVSMGVLL